MGIIMERDKRWERVVAYIGEPLLYNIDENWPPKGEYIDFEIEVKYDGQLFLTRQRIYHLDWEELIARDPEVFAFLMEEMIKFTDTHIKHWDAHHKHLSWTE